MLTSYFFSFVVNEANMNNCSNTLGTIIMPLVAIPMFSDPYLL